MPDQRRGAGNWGTRFLRKGLAAILIGVAGLLVAVAASAGNDQGDQHGENGQGNNPPARHTTTVTTVATTTVRSTTTVATTTTAQTRTVVTPAPPAPPRQMVADISVATVPPAGTSFFAGSTPTYTTVVKNTGPDTATSVHVAVQPEGATVLGSFTSAGSCSGTTEIDCQLGQLASGASAVVTVTLSPKPGSADIIHTARASAYEPDPQVGNNISRLDTAVLAGHPGAPNLSTPGGAFQPPLFARHRGKAWVIATTVHVDEPARLTVQVLDAKGKLVTMLPGTLVNYLPAFRPHTLIPQKIDRARWVPLELHVRAKAGKVYRIIAKATGPDGSTATKTIRFRT